MSKSENTPDKYGHDFSELLKIQRRQLDQLSSVLKPEIHSGIEEYVLENNRPAETPMELHRVWRGNALWLILSNWPHPEKEDTFPPRGSGLI